MTELQLARFIFFSPHFISNWKVEYNFKIFCCVLAPEKTPQGALSASSNEAGTKDMSWRDTQEGTLIMLHPGGDRKESQTPLTTLFSEALQGGSYQIAT